MKLFLSAAAPLLFIALIPNCQINHHECDVDSYAPHCEGSTLVTCEDRSQGEPCVANEGCDTYVTRNACAGQCVTVAASRAECEPSADADAAVDAARDANSVADASIDARDQ